MFNSESAPFYTALTPFVRYDKSLCSDAKLIYSEIFSCMNKEGYCSFDGCYFTDLYGFSEETVEQCLKALVDAGYIHFEKSLDSKELKNIRVLNSFISYK